MKIFGYFLFCFSLVFAPKIGIVDLSVMLPVMFFPLIFNLRLKLLGSFKTFAVFIFVLILYQIFVQMLNFNIELESVARLVRALLVAVIVGLAFGSGDKQFPRDICLALLYALTLHSVLILVASFFPPVNQIFGVISGNDRLKDYRSSGILAGFDIAGFVAIIGLLMIVFNVPRLKSKAVEVVFVLILFSSCYFSSRVSVAIAAVVFLFYFISLIRSPVLSLKFRFLISLILSFAFVYVAYEALVVLEVTMSLGVIDVSSNVASDIIQRSAVQDSDKFLWEDMFYLPNSFLGSVFGTGVESLGSDVGYVKDIFRYGFLGLIFSLIAHFLFLQKTFLSARFGGYAKSHKRLIIIVFLLMLFLTLKNNYIFVRAVFPIFLLISASLVTNLRR